MKREEGLDDLVHILIQLFICTDLLRIAFLGTNPNCLNGFELAVRVMSVCFLFFCATVHTELSVQRHFY